MGSFRPRWFIAVSSRADRRYFDLVSPAERGGGHGKQSKPIRHMVDSNGRHKSLQNAKKVEISTTEKTAGQTTAKKDRRLKGDARFSSMNSSARSSVVGDPSICNCKYLLDLNSRRVGKSEGYNGY